MRVKKALRMISPITIQHFAFYKQTGRMQTTTVPNDIVFAYRDSGPPSKEDYLTVIVFHGHTFHSGKYPSHARTEEGWSAKC